MPADQPAMLKALHSALRNSNFHKRCLPASDLTSQRQYVNWIENNTADPMAHVIIAHETTPAAPIAGWARWVRRPAPAPAPVPGAKPTAFTETMFPAAGDAKPAASFFQANFDAMNKARANQTCSFCLCSSYQRCLRSVGGFWKYHPRNKATA
ncbi:hypothetical protein X797_001030 [Metarhizium robertsii]|uniref:Acyl-CoA N-acyltransferase n=2 Tax=Metarhizium robertsii TaxID=568076 RepID=E9EX13_METRA|nr:Acyl-CoA N-acyltransferase [Metarhizium robertsii ARSEF 23]EFY99633.1 Acyl-CoA N-acyltransferase [Metarhizium robertsii ARSEF 23]EXV06311.1 hypothetical protein X797_001030 [Metarhizium robertsii]